MNWKPIADAPTDRRDLILLFPDREVAIGHRYQETLWWKKGYSRIPLTPPTHFIDVLDLPEPPL